jgi:glycosyltransferase involved in cell wall biosynthesis
MRSIACGRPVIASNFASLSFVSEHQLGIQLDRPADIPAAIARILDNADFYRQRCLDFSRDFVSFEDAWDRFCQRFRQVTQIDLR